MSSQNAPVINDSSRPGEFEQEMHNSELFCVVDFAVSEMLSMGLTFDEAMRKQGVLLPTLSDRDGRMCQIYFTQCYAAQSAMPTRRLRKPFEMF